MSAQKQEPRGGSGRRTGTELPAVGGGGHPPGREGKPARSNGAGLFDERAWAAIARSLDLSRREQELVRGVFDDCTDSSIASTLGISPHTVHTHFERLHQKLGVPNRATLILRVMDEFLTLTASPGSGLPPVCPLRATRGCPLRAGPARR
jgi:DNA-binding CsgD family transcriptional regulator